MKSALIRLSKKIVVDSNTTNEHLKKLFEFNVNNINEWRRGFGVQTWKSTPFSTQQQITREATEFGEAILKQFLRAKQPASSELTEAEKNLVMERSAVEIVDFKEDLSSLIINYTLYSEKLTLIDSLSDYLLLAKGEHVTEIKEGKIMYDLFTVQLSRGCGIIEYQPILV